MSAYFPWRVLSSIAVAAATVALIIVAPVHAQTRPVESKDGRFLPTPQKSLKIYEDSEIKVRIPAGWSRLDNPKEKSHGGTLLLEKPGFTLSLAYHTGHASGIEGGRFIEIFDIPWPGVDDGWTCSGYLREEPWPASRHLVFINLIVESGDPRVRENCGIQKDLGSWIEKDGQKEYDGDQRWFGGYFRTEYGGYFFGSDNDGCGLKAYALTSQAGTPDRLPIADIPNQDNNPALKRTIQEAIDIVNSIHYKRCKPF
jgi:hypothetical protein